jgi:hypothetical protein
MHACSRDTEGSIPACHNYRPGWLLMLQLNGVCGGRWLQIRYCSRDPAFTPPYLAISPLQRSWDATPVHELLENSFFYNGGMGWKVELSFNGRVNRGVRRVALPRKRCCEFSLVRFCISALDQRTWPSAKRR